MFEGFTHIIANNYGRFILTRGKIIFEKGNQGGRLILPDFKAYYIRPLYSR